MGKCDSQILKLGSGSKAEGDEHWIGGGDVGGGDGGVGTERREENQIRRFHVGETERLET